MKKFDYRELEFDKFGPTPGIKTKLLFDDFIVDILENGDISIYDDYADHHIYLYKEQVKKFLEHLKEE